jgi:hypothetical protein
MLLTTKVFVHQHDSRLSPTYEHRDRCNAAARLGQLDWFPIVRFAFYILTYRCRPSVMPATKRTADIVERTNPAARGMQNAKRKMQNAGFKP